MHDTQWKCDIYKNVLKIILLMKEHNKKAKYVDISILLWFYPVLSRKPSESVKTKISTAPISKTKTNFSKIPSKLFSGLQNLVIEINLSRRFS